MKTPAELLDDLQRALDPMESDSRSVIEYADLLCVLTSGPDAETAMDGIHRLMQQIKEHGRNLSKQHEAAWQIVRCLANP